MLGPIPDLLSADARVRIELGSFRQALVFAFAAGGSVIAFDDLVASASLPTTSWNRDAFARDLYLDAIVEKCLTVRVAGKAFTPSIRYLTRVLTEPPLDRRDVEARRAVLTELAANATMRAALERVYVGIDRLRALLCAARQPAPRVRRMEILRAAREVFELLAASFEGARSGLSRLRQFGAAVVAGEPYKRLVGLLDHDENLASLDLRVRVGADGEVRAMEIVAVRENRGNPFYASLWRRLVVRFVLMFRGYRTTSGEVAERLLSEVFSGIEDEVAVLFQLLGDAEVYLGALGLRDRAREKGLAVELPELSEARGPLRLDGLFNPLLLAAADAPTPCDLHVGPQALVIVTGPNSGGKTRLLQAVAITQVLAEAGLFAPARSGLIPRASGLFASLFEEARADQPEGHLGMELLRIRRLFEELGPGALVVLDELCSGTNPSEGEEIARLVLSLLPELGVRAFVTTHLLQFAARLEKERVSSNLEFLQVELDDAERSTYRFVPGVARTSLAHRTAARLGVTREELLARIASKTRRAAG
ncbi:MAG TPA: DNA mismatch repair protein [Polyangiaceae bacterium]|nr:DNA mismatch repair protein [Polyangiaceae bacterium]